MKMKLIKLWKRYEEILRYLIVGGCTTIVSLGVYYISVLTVLDPNHPVQLQIANVLSWVAAVAFAYIANRIFVFQSKRKDYGRELIEFTSSRVVTLLLDILIMFVMVSLLRMNDKIAKLVVQVLVTVLNYVFSKLFVFRGE